MPACERIDAGGIEAHDRGRIHPVAERPAVAARDVDLIADGDVLQKGEMRIAVRRVNGHAAFARVGCPLDMPTSPHCSFGIPITAASAIAES